MAGLDQEGPLAEQDPEAGGALLISPQHDFKRLKRIVTIEQVLRARGLAGWLRQRGADALVGPCPIHGGDNPRAFVVTLSKNLWHCWTRCGGGDVVDLVRCLDGTSYGQTAQTLATLADAAPSQGELLLAPVKRPFRPFTRSLPLDPRAPLLEHKGILPVTARRFEVGAYRGSGFLAGCVGVRLHDLEGYPLGYAGRRLDPIEAHRYGKWKYPQRLPKSELLYGYHRVSSRLDNAVVVVECPWGVMRLTQLGIPAVALLGTHLSRAQRAVLVAIPRVLLMLDGDSAGRSAAVDIERAIGSDTEVGLIRLADGCDPDDLSDEELLIKADHLLV